MKKILSVVICFCMIMTVLPMAASALSASYTDYAITSHDLSQVQTVLAGVAEVTEETVGTESVIKIKLTSDIIGRLHIGEDNWNDWTGAFALDLNGKTIDPGSGLGEAICLDNNFGGSLAITGSGTIKTGGNNLIYAWDATFSFEVAEGYEFFVIDSDDNNVLNGKYTESLTFDWRIRGTELVLTQGIEGNDIVFPYAYDAQRSPAFPEIVGSEIQLRGFGVPLRRDENRYGSSTGLWKLSEAGSYSEVSSLDPAPNTNYLDSIVDSVAEEYGLNDEGKNGILIHKLADETGALVAYGVVIGVDATSGYTLFVGDNWGYDGAGYILSTFEITEDPITFHTEQMAQLTYSVSLSPTAISFDGAEEGYAVPVAETVTVSNTGDAATGALNIALSGTGASDFTLSKASIDDIAVGGNDTFTVVPKENLAAGTYTATITISGDKIMPQTIEVSFVVTAATPTPTPTPIPTPTPTPTPGRKRPVAGLPTNKVEEPKGEVVVNPDAHKCPAVAFEDFDVDSWYHEDIDYVVENEIMNGVSETEFAPDGNLTRAMLVTILYRAEGEPATNRSIPFSDVDMGAYYANAVVWAEQNEIIKGISETEFAPDSNVTREQLATIIFRYAQFRGMDAITTEENLHFDDAEDISEYAITAMNWGIGRDYLYIRSEGKINPAKDATRAEVAAFIHRYMEDK